VAKAREQQVGQLVAVPVAARVAPAEAEQAEDVAPQKVGDPHAAAGVLCREHPAVGTVTHGREVRDQAHEPEEDRNRRVGGHREDVPEQRALEVGPDPVVVGDREDHPDEPDAADVDRGEDARAHDREDGHRLGRAVHRGAPLLLEQAQDRGDQRSGVADADPEHEVGDVPRPVDLVVQAPDTDTRDQQVADEQTQQAHDARGGQEQRGPPEPGRLLGVAADDLGDLGVAPVVEDHGRPRRGVLGERAVADADRTGRLRGGEPARGCLVGVERGHAITPAVSTFRLIA